MMIKKQPKDLTVCRLDCLLMQNGEVICCGKTLGSFNELKQYLEINKVEQKRLENGILHKVRK